MVWHLLQLELAVAVLLTQPVVLGNEPTVVPLLNRDRGDLRDRILQAASSPTQNVLLVLNGVQADERPEASWEVHVEPAGNVEQRNSLVGVVSLFGREQGPGKFVFAIDQSIHAAAKKGLQVRFVPTSGIVIEGAPQAANVRSTVTIGEVSVVIETPEPGER